MSLGISYQCSSKTSCSPIEFTFYPGIYKVELWGAQGGNVTGEAEGGHGGYAMAIIPFRKSETMYFYLGAAGIESSSGFTGNPVNGGGNGNYYRTTHKAASGGGGTDLRKNQSLYSRVLVAGGGSGATSFQNSAVVHNGACGGGEQGHDGLDSTYDNGLYPKGKGGKPDKGGESTVQPGEFGYGGNQTINNYFGSGGGGGWFGGGCGQAYGATGGGGSGYALPSFHKHELISGCSFIPSFYCLNCKVEGHVGNGAARITFLGAFASITRRFNSLCFCLYLFIILK